MLMKLHSHYHAVSLYMYDLYIYKMSCLISFPSNRYLLGFLSYLVEMKIFKKIKVSFLMVGHTHEDIDQVFSRWVLPNVWRQFLYGLELKIDPPLLSLIPLQQTKCNFSNISSHKIIYIQTTKITEIRMPMTGLNFIPHSSENMWMTEWVKHKNFSPNKICIFSSMDKTLTLY